MRTLITLAIIGSCFSCAKSGGGSDLPTSITVDYKVTPSAETFGSVIVGTESAEIDYVFENTGNIPLTNCVAAEILEGDFTEFEISNDECGSNSIAIKGSCKIKVKAKPTSIGVKASALVRRCYGGSTGIPLYAALTAVATYPDLAWNVASYDFGNVASTTTSAPVIFTFSNGGTATATGCSAPTLTGVDAAQFSITVDNCGASDLAFGANCTVTLESTPPLVQSYNATLRRVCTVGGTIDLPITVTGI